MQQKLIAFIVVLATSAVMPQAQTPNAQVLWYRAPAANWNEALPVGNGRLGAMVFGGVADERLQLNEDTVWAGEKRDRINPGAAKAIPEIRRLLSEGKPVEAEALADKTVVSIPRRMPPYQPVGDLAIRFPAGDSSEYRRELDLGDAIARVRFRQGDTIFTREVFSSAVDQVIVVRISGDRPGRVSFSATLRRERDAEVRTEGNDVVMEGRAIPIGERQKDERKTGVAFAAGVRVAAEGGRYSDRRLIRRRRPRRRRDDFRRRGHDRPRARSRRRSAQGAHGGGCQAVRSASIGSPRGLSAAVSPRRVSPRFAVAAAADR